MRYEFAQFTFEPGIGLAVDDRFIRLPAKAQAVLAELLRAAGKTLSKDELLFAVWPNQDVMEDNLFKAISTLRQTFARHGGTDIVQNVHGTGYRIGIAVRSSPAASVQRSANADTALRVSDLCRKAMDFQGTHSALAFMAVRNLLEEALALDPDYEEAWNIWCQHEMYGGRAWLSSPTQCLERARKGALELLRINAKSGFGLVTLGYVRAILDRQLRDGVAMIDAALEFGTSHEASFHKGWVMLAHDDLEGARQAFEAEFYGQSHPRNTLSSLCLTHYLAGRPETAVALAEEYSRKFSPYGSTWVFRALAEAACGDLDAALASARRVANNDDVASWHKTALAYVLVARGERPEAEQLVAEIEADGVLAIPALMAPVYLALGRTRDVQAALDRSAAEKCVLYPVILRDVRMRSWRTR